MSAYQCSTQDGNHVRHEPTHALVMSAARALASETGQTVLVSERGAGEDDYEVVEPPFRVAYLVILDDITDHRATVTAVRRYDSEQRALSAGYGNYDVVTDQALVPVKGERVWIEKTGRSSGRRPITARACRATTVRIRARAFGGVLETITATVDVDGTVSVHDSVAGHYTTCHSLSARDLGRIRAAAKRAL